MATSSIGGMLSSAVTARVRATLDQVATSAPGPGRTADSVSFAKTLRDRLDASVAAQATRDGQSAKDAFGLSSSTGPGATASEDVDALWSRMQAVQTARFGQGDALMAQLDARDEARRTRSNAGSFDFLG
ncbi:MAG: hypothetical protein JWN72_1267 [Thermoleophilia bacterium]|nr:hypothetical protein [Thermoleophilia bacterium]